MNGFIIVPRNMPDSLALRVGYHTFGTTARAAWLRHIGHNHVAGEDAVLINRWSERGWGPRPVRLEVRPA